MEKKKEIQAWTSKDIIGTVAHFTNYDQVIKGISQSDLIEGQMQWVTVPIPYSLEIVEDLRPHFNCKRCSECCKRMPVEVSEKEIAEIASFRNTRPRKIKKMMTSANKFPIHAPFLKRICVVYTLLDL